MTVTERHEMLTVAELGRIASLRSRPPAADHRTFQVDPPARPGDPADVDVLISDPALDPGRPAEAGGAGPRAVRA